MLFLIPFYELHHFALRLSKQQINIMRRSLLLHDNLYSVKYSCAADIQIQIKNPLLSSKERVIGNIHRIRYSYSSTNFKAFSINKSSSSSTHENSTNTPVLRKLSVSDEKLNCMKHEDVKDSTIIECNAIPSTIEELAAPKEFLKNNERCEKKQRTKKAANYLRSLASILKIYYKKNVSLKTSTPKSLDDRAYLERKKIKHPKELKDRYVTSKEKKSIIISAHGVSSEGNVFNEEVNYSKEILLPVNSKKFNAGSKKEVKKTRRRNNTTIAISPDLSFAEKMEQLATSKFVY